MSKSDRSPQEADDRGSLPGGLTASWWFAALAGLAGGSVASLVAIYARKELSVAAFAVFIAVMIAVRGNKQKSLAIACFVTAAAALTLILGQ